MCYKANSLYVKSCQKPDFDSSFYTLSPHFLTEQEQTDRATDQTLLDQTEAENLSFSLIVLFQRQCAVVRNQDMHIIQSALYRDYFNNYSPN